MATEEAFIQGQGLVAVSRRIDAPADQLFATLVQSALHPDIDGSGMIRGSAGDVCVTGVGDTFTMHMHNDNFGDYEMTSHVVEYEPARRIAWEPVMTGASLPDQQANLGRSAHYRWAYTLEPLDESSTLVTESFDCTRSPDWLREAVKDGTVWLDAMTASLEKLEALAGGSVA